MQTFFLIVLYSSWKQYMMEEYGSFSEFNEFPQLYFFKLIFLSFSFFVSTKFTEIACVKDKEMNSELFFPFVFISNLLSSCNVKFSFFLSRQRRHHQQFFFLWVVIIVISFSRQKKRHWPTKKQCTFHTFSDLNQVHTVFFTFRMSFKITKAEKVIKFSLKL